MSLRLRNSTGFPTSWAVCRYGGTVDLVQGDYSVTPYWRVFDSWGNALEAGGLDPNAKPGTITTRALIDERQRLADDLRHPPTTTKMDGEGAFWASTYRNHFDSWADALEAAGVGDGSPQQKIPAEDP